MKTNKTPNTISIQRCCICASPKFQVGRSVKCKEPCNVGHICNPGLRRLKRRISVRWTPAWVPIVNTDSLSYRRRSCSKQTNRKCSQLNMVGAVCNSAQVCGFMRVHERTPQRHLGNESNLSAAGGSASVIWGTFPSPWAFLFFPMFTP